MNNENTYSTLINWPLLPVPNEFGQLEFGDIAQSVRESIQILLRTKPGEQLMRPTFGAGVSYFLHEQNTLATRQDLQELITSSITRWEKRIELNRVEVWEDENNPTIARVEIAYRIIATGDLKTMAVSMELGI